MIFSLEKYSMIFSLESEKQIIQVINACLFHGLHVMHVVEAFVELG